ncbi:MAG: hypothetical protein HUU15_12515 [Candidatus Brocadiae bacterium]|nr:hypothetical protein [Candidatus Brocadiia bacterium]
MSSFAESAGRKALSIVVGLVLFVLVAWVRGRFRNSPSYAEADGPPAPAGRLVLVLDGAEHALPGIEAFLEHRDSGAVVLVLTGLSDVLSIEGPLDLNGDGRCSDQDEFPGDIDDVRSSHILIGRTFRLKGGEDEWVTLPGAGRSPVIEATVTPREYWRPKGYNGTDGWRADVELRVKTPQGERALAGKLEGPVTHTW